MDDDDPGFVIGMLLMGMLLVLCLIGAYYGIRDANRMRHRCEDRGGEYMDAKYGKLCIVNGVIVEHSP